MRSLGIADKCFAHFASLVPLLYKYIQCPMARILVFSFYVKESHSALRVYARSKYFEMIDVLNQFTLTWQSIE